MNNSDFLSKSAAEKSDVAAIRTTDKTVCPSGCPEELFDIVDDAGLPTGRTVPRSVAHSEGYPHRTAHVWILREKNGSVDVLLQKRSEEKDSYPGCFDISSAGHIPAGCGFEESALRELSEELGIRAEEKELIHVKDMKAYKNTSFRGKPFIDREYFRIFILLRDAEPGELALQKEEVSGVKWMSLRSAAMGAGTQTFKNCLVPEEIGAVAEKAAELFGTEGKKSF